MRRAIVSLGTGRKFGGGLDRLERTLDAVGATCDRLLFREYPDGCPTHQQVPYAFKPYLLTEARRRGYDAAIWVDAAVCVAKPLDSAWNIIEKDGHLVIGDGWNLGQWSTETALRSFGITREEAWEIQLILAGILGLNFHAERSQRFLAEWKAFADDGKTFPGPATFPAWLDRPKRTVDAHGVYGHRHDQTAASFLAFKYKMNLLPLSAKGPWVIYEPATDSPPAIFYLRGIPA